MNAFFRKIAHEVMENGWRKTTYERENGTRFHVAIPQFEMRQHGEPCGRCYNEHAEMEMALSLYKEAESNA